MNRSISLSVLINTLISTSTIATLSAYQWSDELINFLISSYQYHLINFNNRDLISLCVPTTPSIQHRPDAATLLLSIPFSMSEFILSKQHRLRAVTLSLSSCSLHVPTTPSEHHQSNAVTTLYVWAILFKRCRLKFAPSCSTVPLLMGRLPNPVHLWFQTHHLLFTPAYLWWFSLKIWSISQPSALASRPIDFPLSRTSRN